MTSDSRIAVVQEFFQRSFRGDISSAIELLDESASYDVPGTHRLSGHFEGSEAVAQHLGTLLENTGHTVDILKWEDWMVGVNHVAALTHMSVQHRSAIQSFRAVYIVTIGDDAKIRRIELYFADESAVERFFSGF